MRLTTCDVITAADGAHTGYAPDCRATCVDYPPTPRPRRRNRADRAGSDNEIMLSPIQPLSGIRRFRATQLVDQCCKVGVDL